jgi:lysophospholipase L1-like esterase
VRPPRRRVRALILSAALTALTGCGPSNGAADDAIAHRTAPGILVEPASFHVPRAVPNDPHLLDALGDPARRLLPLLVALEAIESGNAAAPIDIIQIGDSHTANGNFAARMRELFQQRFGAVGRGMLPAGVPFDYYKPQLVTVGENARWVLSSSFKQGAEGPWGVAGTREYGSRPAEHMELTSTEDQGFSRAALEVLRQPGAGSLDVRIDQGPVRNVPTSGSEQAADWVELPAGPGSHTLSVSPHGDGPVQLLSWDTERTGPGVLYENFGTIGATVDLMGHWDPAILKTEFAHRDPALIVIAFGTNEGFGHVADPSAYEQMFIERVQGIHAAAPGAAIVIIGPPDGNRLYRRAPGQAGSCTAQIADGTPSVASTTRQANMKAGRNAIWAPPPGLAKVRQAERDAAAKMGWFFWDWSAAMGGPCSMYRWVEADPPLGYDDHVHLKADGYQMGAQQLFEELMAQYERYRGLRSTPRPSSAALR